MTRLTDKDELYMDLVKMHDFGKWTNIQMPYGCVTCPFSSQLINGNDECPVHSCLLNFEGIFEQKEGETRHG